MFFPVGLIGNLWNQSFCFSKKRAHCCTDSREEMRYEGSTVITSPLFFFLKKDDAAYTCAKFVDLLCEGPRKVRRRRKTMECERKNNHREDKTVSGKFQCEGEGGRTGRIAGTRRC